MDELREAVALNGLLSGLSANKRAALFQGTSVRTAQPGQVVYEPGDEPAVALMLRGLVRAYVVSGDQNRQATVWYGRCGDFVALEAVFVGPRYLSLQALTESAALIWPVALFTERLKADPVLLWSAATENARRLTLMFDELGERSFASVKQRLARHLLELAGGQGEPAKLIVASTVRALSDAVGTAREVITRTLRTMAEDGLIELERGGVVILDVTRLYDESCTR